MGILSGLRIFLLGPFMLSQSCSFIVGLFKKKKKSRPTYQLKQFLQDESISNGPPIKVGGAFYFIMMIQPKFETD